MSIICINCGAKAEKGCAPFIAGEPAPQAALSLFTQNAKFGELLDHYQSCIK